MNNAKLVGFLQHFANLDGNINRALWSEAPFAGQRVRQSHAFDELHDNEVAAIRQIPGVKDHGSVRMSQPGHGARFAQETIGHIRIVREF